MFLLLLLHFFDIMKKNKKDFWEHIKQKTVFEVL